jgi:hypothetical protein
MPIRIHSHLARVFGLFWTRRSDTVDRRLSASCADKIVQQRLRVFVAEKIPLDLLCCLSVDEFRINYSHLGFEHCLKDFAKLPKKWIFNEKYYMDYFK